MKTRRGDARNERHEEARQERHREAFGGFTDEERAAKEHAQELKAAG